MYFLSVHIYSADYDYKTTAHTLIFEPSNEMRSQQQCLEIEIINDSLPEDWEVFTLLLSTNNSEVDLITHRVDVYIQPNNGNKYGKKVIFYKSMLSVLEGIYILSLCYSTI